MKLLRFLKFAPVLFFFVLTIFSFNQNVRAQENANFLFEVTADEEEAVDPCPALVSELINRAETDSTEPATSPSPAPSGLLELEGSDFTVNPPHECITEELPYVDITFNNLPLGSGGYHLCTGSEKCFEEDNQQKGRLIEIKDVTAAPAWMGR